MPKNWKELLAKLPARRRARIARGTASLAAESRLPNNRPPTHPGEMLLEEFLKPLNLSPEVFARRIRVPAKDYPRAKLTIHNGGKQRNVAMSTCAR